MRNVIEDAIDAQGYATDNGASDRRLVPCVPGAGKKGEECGEQADTASCESRPVGGTVSPRSLIFAVIKYLQEDRIR